jgi:ABC-2 type transport system ATP-binding protein
VLAALSRADLGIADFLLAQPSLDEVFLALTGHTAERAPTAEPSSSEEGGLDESALRPAHATMCIWR